MVTISMKMKKNNPHLTSMIAMTHIRKITTFCSVAAAVLLSAVTPLSASAQTNTSGVTVLQGFNALDYRLQRPLPNVKFDNKRFGDHLFISVEAGPTLTHRSYGQIIGRPDLGARMGLSVGDWLTPVHGLKLGVNLGLRDETGARKNMFGGVTFDYMMNLSSLAHGFNPYRKFDFVGVAGLEYQRRVKPSAANVFGGHLGLQVRYNFNPTTFIYIEPRVSMFSDGVNTRTSWQKYDWEGSLMVGLGYSLSPIANRFRATLDNQYAFDNTFYGFNIGGNVLADPNLKSIKSNIGANGSMYIGTWASTISGWRFMATAGAFGLKNHGHPKFAAAEIDYLLNINSVFNGYNPERRFNTNLILGPALGVTSRTSTSLHLGAAVGMQGVIDLTSNLQMVIEPKALIFNREFAHSGRRANILGSFNIGFQYRIGRFKDNFTDYDFAAATEDYLASKKFFLTAGAGSIYRDSSWTDNLTGWVGVGRWFSPVSAWRITAGADYFRTVPKFADVTLNADYMLSLSSMFAGYNPDRVFDLLLIGGIHGGGARYSGKFHPVAGFQAGLQARFNVSERIDLFIEPQIKPTYAKGYSRKFDKSLRLQVGLSYKLDRRKDKTTLQYGSSDNDTLGVNGQVLSNYVTVTGGPGILSKGGRLKDVNLLCGGFDIVCGHRFSSTSAVQVGLGYDFPNIDNVSQVGIGNIHADYVLDMINLWEHNPARKFHINALVGVGFGWSNYRNSSIGLVAQGGVQFKWDVSKNIDLLVEPRITAWQPRVCLLLPNTEHFVAAGKVMVGASYKF